MRYRKSISLPLFLFAATALAQTRPSASRPAAAPVDPIAGAKENPDAVARGTKLFGTHCAGCHGVAAKGGPGAPDLIRSVLVLDDEKGILIAPVLRDGRPDQGMPKPNLTEAQISDIVAWLHVQTYAADHRTTYTFLDVVTGDAKKGQAYFNTKCGSCHSPTGDLAGIGKKLEPFALQSRWLQPRSPSGATPNDSPRSAIKVTVTLPSGESVTGKLDHIDDFNVSLYDSSNEYHSFARNAGTPKVEVHDPLKAHRDLLAQYNDADIHNVTAYLVTLK